MKRYICYDVTSTCTKSGNTKAVCKHATTLFIIVEMYILFDDPSPLFHLLYMVLTSNFQFSTYIYIYIKRGNYSCMHHERSGSLAPLIPNLATRSM